MLSLFFFFLPSRKTVKFALKRLARTRSHLFWLFLFCSHTLLQKGGAVVVGPILVLGPAARITGEGRGKVVREKLKVIVFPKAYEMCFRSGWSLKALYGHQLAKFVFIYFEADCQCGENVYV